MKQIFIFLLAIIGVAQAQFAPTSAKTRFANGIAFNTRDTSAYNSADSLVVVINRQGRMMYRSTDGLWKYVAINNDTAQMLIAYLRKSDTANMLSPYLRKTDTSAMLSPYARTSSLGVFVPYTGATSNVNLGNFRITARSAANDSILARSSAGGVIATNTGTTVASYGAGGSAEMTFNGFAGYNANRSGSFTDLSFTNKKWVDSSLNLFGLQKVTDIDSVTTNEIIVAKITVDTVGGVAFNSPWRALGVKTNIKGVSHWHGVTNESGVGGGDFTFFKSRPNGQPLQLNNEVWYSEWRARHRTGVNWELSDTSKIFDDLVTVGNTSLPNQLGGLRQFRSVYNGSTVTALSITHLGQVGIRRSNPSFDLDINGTLRAVGNAQFANATIGTGSGNPAYTINGGVVNGTGGGLIGRRGGSDIYYIGSSSWVTGGVDNSNNAGFWAFQNFRVFTNNSSAANSSFTFSNKGFGLSRFTATQASALTSVDNGTIIYVTSTNATFNTVGVWLMDNGSWVRFLGVLNGVATAQRGNFNSLVVNKDSIPITTSNFWALQVDTSGTPGTNRINRRDISAVHTGSIAFDTSSRTLTINQLSGGTTSVVIPRGTASGTSGITALSSTRTGNLVTVSGDNGSSTIFSVRDADSSSPLQSLTNSYGISGSPYNGTSVQTWQVDTSVISTKANVTELLFGYATTGDNSLKLNISDTSAMLSNYNRKSDTASLVAPYLRKSDTSAMLSPYSLWSTVNAALALKLNISDTATMLSNRVKYSDTANIVAGYLRKGDTASMLSAYTRLQRFTDSLTAVQARIQTKQPLGAYITLADSSTILAGRWLPNRSADSIAVIRALANSRGTVFSVATNNGTGINGGTITSTGTLAIDTVLLSTRAWRQKAVDSLNGLINARVRIADTSTMLNPYLRKTDTAFMLSPYYRTATAAAALAGKVNVSDTAAMLSNYRRSSTLILNSNLANSTISGVALGGNLNNHLNGYGISGTAYNGALNQTWQVDTVAISTKANVTGALVAKLNISDTAAMLSNRLRISDTLTMLSRYLRKSDTLTMLNPYLRKTDTSSMLSPYARTSNLPSLAPYLLKADSLSGGYTTWNLTKKKIDSLGAIKMNYTDTASMLSNYYRTSTATGALAAKLNISDTSAMLANRLRISDTSNMLSPYYRTANATAALALKLNISDTASMLSNRLRISDTLTMLSRYLRKSDTATMLAPFVQYSDTANQMNGYLRKNFALLLQDTATAFGNYLRKSDTATILTRYLRKTDTAAMLLPYLRKTDTASMLSPYYRTATATAALGLKLNISDTSTMLLPYLRKTDTTNMLSKYRRTSTLIQQSEVNGLATSLAAKLNISDTNTMLSPYRRTTTKITNSDLANSTISGIALGSNLNNLSAGNGLVGTAYNGGTAQSWRVDTSVISTKANVTGLLVGYATTSALSSYLPLSGGTLTGALNGTTAKFLSGSSTVEALIVGGAGGAGATRQGQLKFGDAGAAYKIQGGEDYSAINFIIGSATVQSIASTGAATFSSSVKSAGLIQPISIKTTNYTLTANDYTVIFDVSGGSKTATLPAGVEGQIYVIKIKGSSSNTVTVMPNGSNTVEGLSSYVVSGCNGTAITIQFLSGNWEIISNNYVTSCF